MKIFKILKGVFYLIVHRKDEDVQWEWHKTMARGWLTLIDTYKQRNDKVMEEFCLNQFYRHRAILTDICDQRKLRQSS